VDFEDNIHAGLQIYDIK